MIFPSPPPKGGPFDDPRNTPFPGFIPYPNQQAVNIPIVPQPSHSSGESEEKPISPRTVDFINRSAASIGVKASLHEDIIWTTR